MTLRAYADLLRIQFAFAWPLLFCSGLVLAFAAYQTFSWPLVITAALIGLFGFEAGMVLNDSVDRERDTRDVEGRLTRYWRFVMLLVANIVILRRPKFQTAMRVLPLFHLAMTVYAAGMVLGAVW